MFKGNCESVFLEIVGVRVLEELMNLSLLAGSLNVKV
jgi:hypothetical protein